MEKKKIKHFLMRNSLRIPFYAMLIAGAVFVASYEAPKSEPAFAAEKYALETKLLMEDIEDYTPKEMTFEEMDVEPVEMTKEELARELIIESCLNYNIDSALPMAIAKLETGHFTSAAFLDRNNVGGMSINEVPIEFGSLEEGVDAFVRNLAENYLGQGIDSVEEISTKYCPVNAENWAYTVNQLLGE